MTRHSLPLSNFYHKLFQLNNHPSNSCPSPTTKPTHPSIHHLNMSLLTPTSYYRSTPLLSRSVMHHARPPRRPFKPSPLEDSKPHSASPSQSGSRSSGTSRVSPDPTNSSVAAEGSNSTTPKKVLFDSHGVALEFHHIPSPTSPSYNTGLVPPILRWVSGSTTEVRSSQSTAPFIRPSKVKTTGEGWEGVGEKIASLEGEMRWLREAAPDRWTRRALMRRYVVSPIFAILL